MKIQETLKKPMLEAKYLNVENTDRYRPIIRLIYLNYEKLKYWMYQEEIFDELREDPYFADYTPEQCQQDLTALTGWGNLVTMQDTKKAATIEEFKNKKFRYQLSGATVEIERMVLRVENLLIESSSLEPTLLERIRISLGQIAEIAAAPEEEEERVSSWWNDLNSDFIRLNQNYQDYMRELNSVKAETMMQTREFLVFKDRLIDYLRNFVKSLQANAAAIERRLRETPPDLAETMLRRVTACELSIPRIDMQVSEAQIYDRARGRWESLMDWFAGNGARESEAARVFDTTNEIIRKITRYAARISEQSSGGSNRREEYYHLAVLFSRCKDMQEAHRLAASVFGMEKPLHLKGIPSRKTDSISSGVFEEQPYQVRIAPRVRNYKEKAQRSGIRSLGAEKEAARWAEIGRIAEEKKVLMSYIADGRLDFAALPEIEPHVRDVFLLWLSRALENRSFYGKTEDGQTYYIENADTTERCLLRASDGVLQMPAYVLRFEQTPGPAAVLGQGERE